MLRCLGLGTEQRIPDANTFWDLCELLTRTETIKPLLVEFDLPLEEQGLAARQGQIVDATLVEAPGQRNHREQNTAIKAGEVPAR